MTVHIRASNASTSECSQLMALKGLEIKGLEIKNKQNPEKSDHVYLNKDKVVMTLSFSF